MTTHDDKIRRRLVEARELCVRLVREAEEERRRRRCYQFAYNQLRAAVRNVEGAPHYEQDEALERLFATTDRVVSMDKNMERPRLPRPRRALGVVA